MGVSDRFPSGRAPYEGAWRLKLGAGGDGSLEPVLGNFIGSVLALYLHYLVTQVFVNLMIAV